jgi:SAM-dependent methyltransferase
MVIEANACTAHAQSASLHAGHAGAEHGCLAHQPSDGCVAFDPARSVEAYTQRLLGELFGWQFAPSVPVRDRATTVISEQLLARQAACDPAGGDLRALAPGPDVNRVLQRLVAIVQGVDLPAACAVDSHAAEFRRALHSELVRRIQADPALRERAHAVRSSAALAETALEHHFSARLLSSLRTTPAAASLPLIGVARTEALTRCLGDFPYTHNYVQLLAAEVDLLHRATRPLLLRDRDLLTLSPAARQTFQAERDKLRDHGKRGLAEAMRPLHEQTIAVCGCGPLPITGLMLHTWTGARVRLVDRDPSSVAAARAWVQELERLRVIERGAVSVHELDIDDWHFDAGQRTQRLDCDIVLVASLVPHAAKQRLARRLQENTPNSPHTLLLRSAAGLCAELAYEAVATQSVNHVRLAFCGESLPRNQVWHGLDALSAGLRGVTADTSSELLVIAHHNVLNSTELYRRLPLSNEQVLELATLERLVASAHKDRTSSNESCRTL